VGLIFSIGFWNCSDIVVFLFFVSFHSFILVQCCLYVWIFVLCLVHSVVCMSGFSFCVLYTVLSVCLDFRSVLYTVLPVCIDFRSVSFTQCCLYVWIFVLCLVHSVACMSVLFVLCLVHSVACMSVLFVLCLVQCCLYVWIVPTWLPLCFSLMFTYTL
jgi:hypothetical protein